MARQAHRPSKISRKCNIVRFNYRLRYALPRWRPTEYTSHSACRAQGNPPSLHVRPARCAHFGQRTARHPEHDPAVPPAQDADHDGLPPHAQATRPVGTRRRSLPSRAVVRYRPPRQDHEHAVHVFTVLWRTACGGLPSVPPQILPTSFFSCYFSHSVWDGNSR